MIRWRLLPLLFGPVLIFAGCGSTEKTEIGTAEERFAHAKQLYDNGDYLEAISEFQVVTLQFSGSAHASEAQFYLGECRYARGEYLLAAFEYEQLRKNYPASPRTAEAQYKLGLCYVRLSPRLVLDQTYTRKAIDELQSFVEYYPADPHVGEADSLIHEMNTKLARKQMQTARLYAVMGYVKASLFYYDDVIERYHDTEFGPLAYVEKAQLLYDRKRYAEADAVISHFISLYPSNVLRGRADQLKEQITNALRTNPAGVTGEKGMGEAGGGIRAEQQGIRP